MALVLAPELPLAEWIKGLDEQIARSASFFDNRPIIVDLSAIAGHQALDETARHDGMRSAMEALQSRDLRLIGVEGADPAWADDPALGDTWGRTPLISSGRGDRAMEIPDDPRAPASPAPPADPPFLVIDGPIRSGQSVIFDRGDVTIVGAVASGAEVIAGGSIHVYGALRGRAIAGLMGQPGARIFCARMEAELLAIDGVYKTADDIAPALRGRAVQAWLQGDSVLFGTLD